MTDDIRTRDLRARATAYCVLKLGQALPADQARLFERYLLTLIQADASPPQTSRGHAWREIVQASRMDADVVRRHREALRPALDMLVRARRHSRSTERPVPSITTTRRPCRGAGEGRAPWACPPSRACRSGSIVSSDGTCLTISGDVRTGSRSRSRIGSGA